MSSNSEYTDEDLARGVQLGESCMFAVLIERYEAKMLRYARKFLFAREDGQDLVQEVFLKAYTNMCGFDAIRAFGIRRIDEGFMMSPGMMRRSSPELRGKLYPRFEMMK